MPEVQLHMPVGCTDANLSDETLLVRASSGNNEALGLLFRRYARIIRGLAYKVLRDPFEADDLLQEVFLLIHKKSVTFDSSKGSARSWILRTAYHCAISRRRYLNCRHFYTSIKLDDAEDGLQRRAREAQSLEKVIEGRMDSEDLLNLFEVLSENQRLALRLYFFEGCTFDEIAAKLGQTRENIRHHYFRGLEKLRKQIFRGRPR
jgi:RNA polymerase sigma-70 factor (ECF subfamily)